MVNRVGWSIKAIFKEEMSNYEELYFHGLTEKKF